MNAGKKTSDTTDWVNSTVARLQQKKERFSQRFENAVDNLSFAPALASQPSLAYDDQQSPSAHAHIPDGAKQQALGVTEILAKLGIGKVASVHATTLAHTPTNTTVEPALAQNA